MRCNITWVYLSVRRHKSFHWGTSMEWASMGNIPSTPFLPSVSERIRNVYYIQNIQYQNVLCAVEKILYEMLKIDKVRFLTIKIY